MKLWLEHADTAFLALSAFFQSLLSTESCQIIRTATFADFFMNESSLMAPDAPSAVSLLDHAVPNLQKHGRDLRFAKQKDGCFSCLVELSNQGLDWSSPFLYLAPFHISLAQYLSGTAASRMFQTIRNKSSILLQTPFCTASPPLITNPNPINPP
jgi:hypothetical protein